MRNALGERGLRVIKEAADTAADIEKQAKKVERRRRIEKASVRPTPGSSNLLARSLEVQTSAGIDANGNLRTVEVYDLLGMAPIHLATGDGFKRARDRQDGLVELGKKRQRLEEVGDSDVD